jgi:DNA-binding MarR family transcriptional regulator
MNTVGPPPAEEAPDNATPGDIPHVAVLMFVAGRHFEQRIVDAVLAAGHTLTLAQMRIAARLDPGGTRLTTLADSAQVTKQTAGFLVDQLQRGGYVDRVADPTDARARLVRLSGRGLEVQTLARGVERQVLDEWTAHLGEDRMRALRGALVALREITDPYR